jgi:hypothetical protein
VVFFHSLAKTDSQFVVLFSRLAFACFLSSARRRQLNPAAITQGQTVTGDKTKPARIDVAGVERPRLSARRIAEEAKLAPHAIGHAIVLAVRRRRRDLAVLRTLGFQRSQVHTTVACQASTYAVLSLLVGIPLGIAVGRLIWRAIAESLGVVPAFSLSAFALVILVLGTLLVLNVIGALAARSAIHMRPASVLRTE